MSRFVGMQLLPESREARGVWLETETWTAGNVLWGGHDSLVWLCWGHWDGWDPPAPARCSWGALLPQGHGASGSGQLFNLKEEQGSSLIKQFLTYWPRGSLLLHGCKGNVWAHSVKFSFNEVEPPASKAGKWLWASPLVLVNRIVNSSSYLSTATPAECWWCVCVPRQNSSRKCSY